MPKYSLTGISIRIKLSCDHICCPSPKSLHLQCGEITRPVEKEEFIIIIHGKVFKKNYTGHPVICSMEITNFNQFHLFLSQ